LENKTKFRFNCNKRRKQKYRIHTSPASRLEMLATSS
jgi:hypothetical protein